jgi:hypothetical protein
VTLSAGFFPLASFTLQEWFWSGGLIELSLVLTALLVAAWLVNRPR